MNAVEQPQTMRRMRGVPVAAHADSFGPETEHRVILGTRVDATSYEQVQSMIGSWIATRQPAYVCIASVHPVMEALDDPAFKEVLDSADVVTPDGMPLVWGLRALGTSSATRVYGPELTDRLCAWAAAAGIPVGFHGSTPAVLGQLIANLRTRHPGLKVNYACSPPFRALTLHERRREIQTIRESGARLLFVGLGCPKQERWMAERVGELDLVMVGVGAAFDYLAGTAKRPPRLLQRLGLEWLFRLSQEPRRLWRRYLRNNPRFLLLFAWQLITHWAFEEGQ